MSDGMGGGVQRRRAYSRRSADQERLLRSFDLGEFLEELAEIRGESRVDIAGAGERALKTLDRFLATLARAFGMTDERPSMSDSLRHLTQVGGTAAAIARQADRYRDTRNALAHNPDISLRPEAAARIIDGVEGIVRMAAGAAHEIARHRVVCVAATEHALTARDTMLEHGYNQLVVTDERGGVLDLLTERDLVSAEAGADLDGDEHLLTVAEVIANRGYPAVALLPRTAAVDEVVAALRDEPIGAVVVTENGRACERPLGIITRGDVLKLL